MNRMAISAFATAILLSGAGLAHAQGQPVEEGLMAVHIGDLNLQSTEGARTALNRVRSASNRFCGTADPRELARSAQVQQCRQNMGRKAVAAIDAPMVTALFEQTSPNVLLAAR